MYNPTTWVNGTSSLNQTAMNNLETQYTEAINSYNQDLFNTGFVLTGLFCSKDGSIANQLDYTSGVYYALQSDSTTRRRALTASHFTTATPSTTYYFDANPDGTTSWGTSHSVQTNYVPICQVTTDGSGNILTVTDERNRTPVFFPSLLGTAGDTNGGLAFGATTKWGNNLAIDQLGSSVGTAVAQPAAPSVALAAGGSMGTGVYQYVVTLMSVNGESQAGATASITTTSGNNTVSMTSIPTGPTGTIGRNIYRTAVGGSVFKLLRTLHDNTTTSFTDTFADGNLVSQNPPVHPTMGADVWKSSGGSTVAAIFADGAAQFSSISSLGGQASAGAFGAPVIVAQVLRQNVTVTTVQTILTFSVPASGIYRVSGTVMMQDSAARALSFSYGWTDPDTSIANAQWFQSINGSAIQAFNATNTWAPNVPYGVNAVEIAAKVATNLTITYQHAAGGTANDFVSVTVERLA